MHRLPSWAKLCGRRSMRILSYWAIPIRVSLSKLPFWAKLYSRNMHKLPFWAKLSSRRGMLLCWICLCDRLYIRLCIRLHERRKM
jgi:hypothetical protein